MPDQTTTPDPALANPASVTTQAAGQAAGIPAGLVEAHRLTSAMQKIQELTLANRTLADQLATFTTSSGELRVQLANQEASIATKASEHAKLVSEFEQRESGYKTELTANESLKRKLKAIKEVGRPELLSIIDILPEAADDAAQVIAIKGIAEFASQQAQVRETQLTAGITRTEVVSQAGNKEVPTSDDGWAKYMEQFPLGSEDRATATDQWFTYLTTSK